MSESDCNNSGDTSRKSIQPPPPALALRVAAAASKYSYIAGIILMGGSLLGGLAIGVADPRKQEEVVYVPWFMSALAAGLFAGTGLAMSRGQNFGRLLVMLLAPIELVAITSALRQFLWTDDFPITFPMLLLYAPFIWYLSRGSCLSHFGVTKDNWFARGGPVTVTGFLVSALANHFAAGVNPDSLWTGIANVLVWTYALGFMAVGFPTSIPGAIYSPRQRKVRTVFTTVWLCIVLVSPFAALYRPLLRGPEGVKTFTGLHIPKSATVTMLTSDQAPWPIEPTAVWHITSQDSLIPQLRQLGFKPASGSRSSKESRTISWAELWTGKTGTEYEQYLLSIAMEGRTLWLSDTRMQDMFLVSSNEMHIIAIHMNSDP